MSWDHNGSMSNQNSIWDHPSEEKEGEPMEEDEGRYADPNAAIIFACRMENASSIKSFLMGWNHGNYGKDFKLFVNTEYNEDMC